MKNMNYCIFPTLLLRPKFLRNFELLGTIAFILGGRSNERFLIISK